MKAADKTIFIGDFETTVYEGQTYTEVWASALVEIGSEDVIIHNSIEAVYDYLTGLKKDVIVYYHNLKFDGSFWLDYLLIKKRFKQASYQTGEDYTDVKWVKSSRKMPSGSVMYSISDMGMWYRVIFKVGRNTVELRDSLKLIPLPVVEIGRSYKTKHQKLTMEYKGFRYAGCEITPEERKYIANDVLVVKEALEIMFEEGHDSLTIGACALTEFKNIIGKKQYKALFPDMYSHQLPYDYFKPEEKNKMKRPLTAGDYIRKAYKGGWCYLVPEKAHKIIANGLTADVNSLYPSVMHSESGCKYPYGEAYFWKGNYIPQECISPNVYYFIRIKTRFYIKPNKLPFIQIKSTFMYKGTECLRSSDVWIPSRQRYESYYTDPDGKICDTRQTLTLTMTDYMLFLEHYEVVDFEILDGCYFMAMAGIFDEYINKYRQIKMNSKGGRRQIAKLFLNSLYGKTASSMNSSFKYAYIDEGNLLKFLYVEEEEKQPGYIPIGAAITSYARNFTIRAAQKNYYGADNPGFIYADTDSIHCDLPPDKLEGVPVHPTAFCHWKLENYWDTAYFVRQKTYIEHVTAEDGEAVEKPYYNIKCAGMPGKCKKLYQMSMTGYTDEEYEKLTEEEKQFVKTKRSMSDFDLGLVVPGKLMPKRIPGGVILVDTTFEMR